MSPEMIIAAVSGSCGVLLVVGGVLVGRAMAERAANRRLAELQALAGSLRDRTQELTVKADGARAEAEAIRLESDERVAKALGEELAKSEKMREEFEDTTTHIAELKAKLEKAEGKADEADKEFTIVREKLDATEKRLAETKRELAELEAKASASSDHAREIEQAQAKIKELEASKSPADAARVRGLQEQLKAVQDAEGKLRMELKQRDKKIEELTGALAKAGETAADLQKEIEAFKERIAVSERVMEGVRARSGMLSQELKKAQEEIARLTAG